MKGFLKVVLIIIASFFSFFLFILVTSVLFTCNERSPAQKEKNNNWHAIKKGDSLFFKNYDLYDRDRLQLYSTFRVNLNYQDEKRTKFNRKDTAVMGVVRSLHEKYFYLEKSGYFGKVLEKVDKNFLFSEHGIPFSVLSYTDSKDKWLKVKLSESLTKKKTDSQNNEILDDDLLGKYWITENKPSSTKLIDNAYYIPLDKIRITDTIFPTY